ncbi:MAG: phosphatidic acid phosphatase [Dehalogenimonas sp.]|uniref:Phosphatidic acid phosphatase n=1 Tax=Candidatus Dehalogenimonas loeffleri TaxID=3127115 RepID=A0ABZ2J347_9CHLR|nr:phosphatidic acid phosphatase [Dehalogenimonas sp.]
MTQTKIANYISDGLNPLALGIIILAAVSFDAAATTSEAVRWFLLVTVLNILPVLTVAIFLVRSGRMDALFSNRRHQRHRIYVIGLFFTVMTLLLLNWMNAPAAIFAVLVITLVTVVTFAAVNLWWKISVHTSTTSAFVVILHVLYGWWALPSLLLLPAMAWSRVKLAQHTLGQVIAGAVVSAVIVLVIFFQNGLI